MKRLAQLAITQTGWKAELMVFDNQTRLVGYIETDNDNMAELLLMVAQWVEEGIVLVADSICYTYRSGAVLDDDWVAADAGAGCSAGRGARGGICRH